MGIVKEEELKVKDEEIEAIEKQKANLQTELEKAHGYISSLRRKIE